MNLDTHPLRVLDGATTIGRERISWKDLGTKWTEPTIVPKVKQSFDWYQAENRPTPPADEAWPVPENLIREPRPVPEPFFSEQDALTDFGHFLFSAISRQNFPDANLELQVMSSNKTHMRSFRAGGLLFFTFDVTDPQGAEEFCSRVREPVRRPPPEMASFAASQRILGHDVCRISLKTSVGTNATLDVGWYFAVAEMPR
jgi:hypothetical protein